ncbi:unnamed protein product [Cyprideis torosa]|uniref:Uncharacterized protein n=1 Tax=Cyprideis torosa TaxID=163714 RepID=A0A7R8WDW8_9CRUS|nr:unnamed protein product [Cyprideis torosa]CAG0893661.1 unnamed protein product [Cyprideis torosa]
MSRQLSPLESSIKELFSTLEIQKSKKSDHEMQKERDTRLTPEAIAAEQELKLDNLRTPGTPAIKAKADDKVSTAQDREDQWQDEFNEFTLPPVPVRPGYDDSRLYLLVQNNDNWRLPHEPWRKDDRSLRDTAERLLTDIVEPNDVPRILILGNAPFGFHKFKYPTTSAEGALGAKVFFYKARVSPLSCDKPQTLLDSPAPLFPRDEHQDFIDEMTRQRALRGKPPSDCRLVAATGATPRAAHVPPPAQAPGATPGYGTISFRVMAATGVHPQGKPQRQPAHAHGTTHGYGTVSSSPPDSVSAPPWLSFILKSK